jgi:mono/diheme cytochrome c family protein
MNGFSRSHRTFWALFAVLAGSHAARADDDRRAPGVPLLPAYRQECAACHVAFAPGMLPSDSWRRLLNNLPRHFGTDASLDAATARELATWLSTNAGTYRGVREAPAEDRITKSAWFVRKHDEVPADAWKRAAVKSAANCTACHGRASQGDFNEHSVRIPR